MRILILSFLLFIGVAGKSQPLYFPPLVGTAWDTIAPGTLGWCQPQLDSLIDYVGATNSKAFMILKDGKIVVEEYYGTFTSDSLWYWASAGKSLTSVLVGIAQQEGFLSINDTSSDYLGVGWTVCPPTKEEKITILNQLTMTTGLDDGVADPNCTIDTCLQYLTDADTRWAYHTAPYTKLDGVISGATGVSLNTYLTQKISTPTGIAGLFIAMGSNNVFVSKARSMARFGLLMLNGGNWNGTPVLSDTVYFSQMTNTSQSLNPSYGYLWWLNGKSSYMIPGLQFSFSGSLLPSAPADMYSAIGRDGQIVNVIPSLNMVVVRMGDAPFIGLGSVPLAYNDSIWNKLSAVMCSSVALQEIEEQELKVYPNPSSGTVTLEFPGKNFSANIYDLNGREVMHANNNYNQFVITTGALAKGWYTVKINSGDVLHTVKFVLF